jgi:hypothetical protein
VTGLFEYGVSTVRTRSSVEEHVLRSPGRSVRRPSTQRGQYDGARQMCEAAFVPPQLGERKERGELE